MLDRPKFYRYRRTLSWALPIGLFVLFTLSLGWVYSRNSLFRFSEVEISAQDPRVESWVRTRLLGYLGQSLFTIPLNQVENDLMQLKQIKKVYLRRHWPAKISVELELRKPIALVWNQRSLWLVDSDGVLFQKMMEARDLPILRGFSLEKLSSSSPRGADWKIESSFIPSLDWLQSLAQSEDDVLNYRNIDEVIWEDEKGLVLKSYEMELSLDVGRQDFDSAWSRSLKAYSFLKTRGQKALHLDASYRSRVVGITQPSNEKFAPIQENAQRDSQGENALVR